MKLIRILPAFIAVVISMPALAFGQENPEGGGGGGGRGGRGGRGGFGGVSDQLKDTLDLSDEQVAKVKAIEEEQRTEMQKARDAGERPNFMEAMKKTQEKIKGILTDTQKPKFEEWTKKMEERFNGMGGGRGGPGGGRDRGDRDKELADRAEKELTLTADEKAAVMPLVKKVLETRAESRKAGDTRREELKKFLKDVPGTTDAQRDEIATKIKDIKKAKEGEDTKIKEAENALREVLTPENEAKLMAMGIL